MYRHTVAGDDMKQCKHYQLAIHNIQSRPNSQGRQEALVHKGTNLAKQTVSQEIQFYRSNITQKDVSITWQK